MAASPGKVDGEAAEEVEEGPGQDNDVVDVQEDNNHLGSISDACRAKLQNWARDHGQSSHTPPHPRPGGDLLSTVRALDSTGPRRPALSSASLAGDKGLFSLRSVALYPGSLCPSTFIGSENSLI